MQYPLFAVPLGKLDILFPAEGQQGSMRFFTHLVGQDDFINSVLFHQRGHIAARSQHHHPADPAVAQIGVIINEADDQAMAGGIVRVQRTFAQELKVAAAGAIEQDAPDNATPAIILGLAPSREAIQQAAQAHAAAHHQQMGYAGEDKGLGHEILPPRGVEQDAQAQADGDTGHQADAQQVVIVGAGQRPHPAVDSSQAEGKKYRVIVLHFNNED